MVGWLLLGNFLRDRGSHESCRMDSLSIDAGPVALRLALAFSVLDDPLL